MPEMAHRSKAARPNWFRGPFGLVLMAIVAGGLFMIGKGLYIHAKATFAQILLESSFSPGDAGATGRPWPWADFTAEARLTARRIGRSEIVLSDAGGEALAFGPTHLANTPMPGEAGTAVIAAHRDTHFRWLEELRPGDLIDVRRRDGGHAVFRVSAARIARSDASGIDAAREGHWIALATCWPFDARTRGPLRYIVEAEQVTGPDGIETAAVE